jgi:thiamine-phosphate pyrophosphorylase
MSVPKTATPHLPRIYLTTSILGDVAGFVHRLREAVDAADVAAVLLRFDTVDDRSLIKHVKALAPAIQERGIAVLLDGHVDLVARAGADGAHVAGADAIKDALRALKPERMVGAGGLHSRHDAMIVGEAGADYVLFGEPDQAGHRPSLDAIVDRLSWWAEVFQPPCVGYAQHLSEIGALAATGADFILLGDAIWDDRRGPVQALVDATSAIESAVMSQTART